MKLVQPRHTYMFAGTQHAVYHCRAGEGLPRHEHDFPHTTICHAGSCIVRKQNVEKLLTPSDGAVLLKASEWHEIEALQDGTVFENAFIAGAT